MLLIFFVQLFRKMSIFNFNVVTALLLNNHFQFREYSLKGVYCCTADLLFILFALRCFANVEWTTVLLVWSNPNQSNRRSAVLWCFLLWWGFSARFVTYFRSVLRGPISQIRFSHHWLISRRRRRWSCFIFLKNGPTTASFSFIFGLYKQTLQFLQQISVKKCHVHPVSGARIRTHNLWNVSLLP